MFTKNTYLFPQVSPFQSRPSPNSVVASNGAEIFLHHHHQDAVYGNYLAAANAPVLEAAALFNQDAGGLNADPSAMANACPRKQTGKKDRHSKIHTAQGPRDRRVRLSIGIARKFFDLQEMLGFDKPSKTLDWLLTKSRTAIKDLVQTKQKAASGGAKSVSSRSECEVESEAALENGIISLGVDSKGKSVSASNLAKESRVKARARARERTREKMCIKQINQTRNNPGFDLNPSNPIQFMNNQLEVCKISGPSSAGTILHCPPTYGAPNEGLFQESIVIKRKVKNQSSSIYGFQQNFIIPSPHAAAENWEISSFTSQPAFLDQHRFINRSTSNN